MQYAWRIVLAERVEQGTVCKRAAMAHAELPADDLPGFEVKHCRQIVPCAVIPQVGKILHPCARTGHAAIVHAVLWPAFVAWLRIWFQRILRHRYLWCGRLIGFTLFCPGSYRDTCERTDAPRLRFAPTELDGEPCDAVELVLLMGGQ